MNFRRNPWAMAARHAMLDLDLSVSSLAKEIGVTRSYLSSVLSGRVVAPNVIDKVTDYLKLTVPYSVPKEDTLWGGSTDSMVEGTATQARPMSVPEVFADDDIDGMSATEPRVEIYADDSHLLDEEWW